MLILFYALSSLIGILFIITVMLHPAEERGFEPSRMMNKASHSGMTTLTKTTLVLGLLLLFSVLILSLLIHKNSENISLIKNNSGIIGSVGNSNEEFLKNLGINKK